MLIDAVRGLSLSADTSVLDACSGSGAVAIAAAQAGAGNVTAIDISRRAVLSTRVNALFRGLPVRARRVNLLAVDQARRYDLVVSNPPYVPTPLAQVARPGQAWDAGPAGRAVLDPICAILPTLLNPGGRMLLVHSALSDVDQSLSRLRAAGLSAAVIAHQKIPFGPVLHSRTDYLVRNGFITSRDRSEEIVVIAAENEPVRAPRVHAP